MDERVRSGIALVLGEVQADVPASHRDEPRKAGLELMLPLLVESEAPVPRDGAQCVLDV